MEVGESVVLVPFAFEPPGFPRVSGLWVVTSLGKRVRVGEESSPVCISGHIGVPWYTGGGGGEKEECEDILLGT